MGGAPLDAVRPENRLRRMLRGVFTRRQRDLDWGVEDNPDGRSLLVWDGTTSDAKHHALRVQKGATQRRPLTPTELAEHEAYLDLKGFQAW